MRLRTITVALLLASISRAAANAEDKANALPTLVGQWKSDVAKTMAFNERHAKLEPGQIAALKQLFGKNTLAFTDSECTMTMPSVSIKRSGKSVELDALEETFPYFVVATTSDAVAIKVIGATHSKSETLSIWHFENGYVWTYVGDSPFGWFHVREYFRRIE
jgi:hypothetical protein